MSVILAREEWGELVKIGNPASCTRGQGIGLRSRNLEREQVGDWGGSETVWARRVGV